MAIITLNCNLNGGDDVTPNNELFYRIYGNVDNYASPIHTTGTAIADANVTVNADVVVITSVDGTTNTSFKIAAVDEAGNEGVLSDAYSSADYYLEFLLAQTDEVPYTVQFTQGQDFYIEVRMRQPIATETKYMGANDDTYSGNFRLYFANNSGAWFFGWVSDGTVTSEPVVSNEWITLKIEYTHSNDTATFFANGVQKGTAVGEAPTSHPIIFPIGRHSSEAFNGDWDIDWIDMNGDKFEFNEGSGGTVNGSVSGANSITTDRANVDDMWATV